MNLASGNSAWRPTRLVRVDETRDTSMGTARVKTDAGTAYLKAMGNREGPHALACELVGSSLARWFGLTVPPFAIFDLAEEACFPLERGARTAPGPCFVSKHTPGRTWQGTPDELQQVENPADFTRIVVFDTWVRNCDRHPPDLSVRKPNYANVYLAETESPERSRLLAIDHTHCFDCGRPLGDRLARIDLIKDEGTFGLFPAFSRYIDPGQLAWCKALLREVNRDLVDPLIAQIPPAWDVEVTARSSLRNQIVSRAGFVADRIEAGWLASGC